GGRRTRRCRRGIIISARMRQGAGSGCSGSGFTGWRRCRRAGSCTGCSGEGPVMRQADYTELAAMSNFSFLRGGSHPGELVAQAAIMGLSGLGLCDRNSFAGVVRGYQAMREIAGDAAGFRYLVGVRLCFADATPDILAYPADR